MTPTTGPPTGATTSTTAQARDLDEELRSILRATDFSADIAVTVTQTQAAGVSTQTGLGRVFGADSSYSLVTDLSGIRGTFFDFRNSRIVGIGATQSSSEFSVVVDGIMYQQNDGGLWRVVDAEMPETTVGYIFSELAAVESYEQIGTEPYLDGELAVLRPVRLIEYDPSYFGISASFVNRFDAETTLLVDSEGIPLFVRISLAQDFETAGASVQDIEYLLSNVGTAPPVEPPRAWITSWSLGLETYIEGTDGETLQGAFLIEVPAEWTVIGQSPGELTLRTPTSSVVQLASAIVGPRTVEEQMTATFRGAGFDPPLIEEPAFSVFPSGLAAATVEDQGFFYMLYVEVGFGVQLANASWTGPLEDTDAQRAEFEEMLQTIRWPDSSSVPGLQADVAPLVVATAAVYTGCNDPRIVWVELVRGGAGSWVEDWYVSTCGTFSIHEVAFSPADGGTNFEVATEGRRVPAGAVGFKSLFDLKFGDCFDDPTSGSPGSVPIVDCADPHDNEVYAEYSMTDPEFPGVDAVREAGFSWCEDEFEGYVGIDLLDSELDIFPITPSAETWAEGDRIVLCVLYGLDLSKLTGTMNDSGR